MFNKQRTQWKYENNVLQRNISKVFLRIRTYFILILIFSADSKFTNALHEVKPEANYKYYKFGLTATQ